MTKKCFPGRAFGVTLVELLIALVLSLLFSVGAVTVFVSSKDSYNLQQAVSRTKQDASAVLLLLEEQIRLAGYADDDLAIGVSPLKTGVVGGAYEIQGTDEKFSDTIPSDNDELIVQFELPGTDFMDCSGFAGYAAGDIVAIRVAILRDDDNPVVGSGDLICEGGSNGPATLLENVSNFRVEYGRDTAGSTAPDEYLAYDNDIAFSDVVAIKLSFSVLPEHGAFESDSQASQFSTTIALRNQVYRKP